MDATTNTSTLEAMQAMMIQMQDHLQQQLQRQQNEFQVRMESLLIGKGKAAEVPMPASTSTFKHAVLNHSLPTVAEKTDEAQIGIATDEGPQATQGIDEEATVEEKGSSCKEDMADYFDAKVDLQAYVFDSDTPESELILDVLEGLPDYMLPTLKSSITPDMDL
ncbi:hypothetical protein QFC20_001336 [Naganishia adeliensis]|uniref:Uncharacterized protein n=1 Tax=Naganishia adeliensis TaxID=92952 RepID=A0ACC2WV20_9TREE|nr:hypothetical protein QFC20_001336 [Naganishia adeliensis]